MEREQLHEKLRKEIDWQLMIDESLCLPGSLGNIYNRFYTYSFGNQLLLYMQGVREPVATYQRWQDMGRQVLKGSKAKAILRPVTVKSRTEVDSEGNPKKFTKFKLVNCLFTASETEGEELPAVEPMGWDLDTALEAMQIKRIPFEELNGNVQGHSIEREFAINPVAVHPLKTTFHELGHIALGHTTGEKLKEYATHRGVMEFQAEAVSYLVANELEVATEEVQSVSRAYIQHWLGGQRPPDQAIRQVFQATDTILKSGRMAVGEQAA